MPRLLLSLVVTFLLVSTAHCVVYLRILDVVPGGVDPAPTVAFWLDGVRLNAKQVLYGHFSTGSNSEPLYYYATTPGDHQLLVTRFSNSSIVYVNTTISGLADGNYYTTIAGGSAAPWTLQDDPGTNVPAGFTKLRVINYYNNNANNSLIWKINGVNNATFYDRTVSNGDYILVDNTNPISFTIANTFNPNVFWVNVRNQTLQNWAYSYWLIGGVSTGGTYNGTIVDGANAAVYFESTTTPAATTTSPSATTATAAPTGTANTNTGATTNVVATTKPSTGTTSPTATTQPPNNSSGAFVAISFALVAAAMCSMMLML